MYLDFTYSLAIYAIVWWVVFFAILPIGVRTQGEEDEVEPGTVESAPVNPRIGRKALITTVVAAGVFAVVYAVIASGIIPLSPTTS